MQYFSGFILAIVATFSCLRPAIADDDDVLSKATQIQLKEPAWSSDRPLFARAAMGSTAATNVWFALDKSHRSTDGYDVLFVDLNANGDLTEKGEQFSWVDEEGQRMRKISLPNFVDAGNGETHTNFGVSMLNADTGECLISLRWRDEHKIGGGYPEDPETGYMKFSPNAETAPVVWFNGDAPFRFQRWTVDPFVIGSEEDIRLFLGWTGRGRKSFCSTQTHVLPKDEPVLATLIYVDIDDKQQSIEMELTERC